MNPNPNSKSIANTRKNAGIALIKLILIGILIMFLICLLVVYSMRTNAYNINPASIGISSISGKIKTENLEEKYTALVKLYKTNDTEPRESVASAETNEDGTYSFDVPTGEEYDIVIIKPGYLKYTITNIMPVNKYISKVQDVELIAGDVVETGEIEISDLVYMNNNIYKKADNVCDLNEDGSVDEKDREILERNYTKLEKKEEARVTLEAEQYVVSYDLKGGSGIIEDQIKTAEIDLTLSEVIPTKQGYAFLGWSTNSSTSSVDYEAGGRFDLDEDTVLYAVWEENIVPLSIAVSEDDCTNLTRKTNKTFEDLFEIDWGSGEEGTTSYSISGNLNFKNTSLTSTSSITNASQLEVGNYTVSCTASNETGTVTKTKNINITKLAKTEDKTATAIYSEYDLAYFRDLVNSGNRFENETVFQMNDIDLSNVCSESIGNWEPIGYVSDTKQIWFNGIFDGNNKKIKKIYINSSENKSCGLFGFLGYKGILRNIECNGQIIYKGNRAGGGIVGRSEGNIKFCINNVQMTSIYADIGGIVGVVIGNNNGNYIENCINNSIIKGNNYGVGGIVGRVQISELLSDNNNLSSNDININNCINKRKCRI